MQTSSLENIKRKENIHFLFVDTGLCLAEIACVFQLYTAMHTYADVDCQQIASQIFSALFKVKHSTTY